MHNFDREKQSSFPRFILILSIPLLLFVGVLLGFLQYLPLKVELHSLLIVFIILFIFLFFISHNAWYAYSEFKDRIVNIDEEIDVFLTKTKLSIDGNTKSYANLDEFFKPYLENLRNDNFASIAASIFPTLGILGTFTAIAISMPNFTVESQAALENEITILLSGVGTAFYASIYGIFLSIWWVFFDKRGLSKVDNEVARLKNSYEDLIWSKKEIELLTVLQSSKQNNEFFEKIQGVLTPDYIFKLDEIANVKLKHLEQINKSYIDTENKLAISHNKFIDMFEQTTNKENEVLQSFEKIQSSIVELNQSLEKSLENQNSTQKALKAEIYSALASLQLVSSDLREFGKDILNEK